jgi:diguanylate cyclase (GGDEF)-like protein
MKLKRRLDLAAVAVMAALLASLLVFVLPRAAQEAFHTHLRALQSGGGAFAYALRDPLVMRDYSAVKTLAQGYFESSDLAALHIVDAQGKTLVSQARTTEALEAGYASSSPAWFRNVATAQPPTFDVSVLVGGTTYARIHLEGNPNAIFGPVWAAAVQLTLFALLAMAVMSVAFGLFLRRGFRPLTQLQQAAEGLSRGVRVKLDENVVEELRLPVKAFNHMTREITRLLRELRRKNADLEATFLALESLSDGALILDADHAPRYANPSYADMVRALPGLTGELVARIGAAAMRHGQHQRIQMELTEPMGGAMRMLDVTLDSLPGADGAPAFQAVLVRDITRERQQAQRLDWEARHDPLTGLPNRFEFARRLDTWLDAHQPGMVLVMDINQLKEINSAYGYSVGDRLLRRIVDGLSSWLGAEDLLARYSGGEFILLAQARDYGEARRRAEGLLRAVPELRFHEGETHIQVTATLGGMFFDAGVGLGAESLIGHVEAAALTAKHAGRNRLALFDQAMPEMERIRADRDWMERIVAALESGCLQPRYQPIIEVASGRVSHYEALARLVNGDLVLDAGRFIPHAERLGVIGEVDCAMLVAVLETLRARPDVTLATNISGDSVNNPSIVTRMLDIIAAHADVSPRLVLELTESVALHDYHDAHDFFHAARVFGCRIAIDDFGIGYSSLQHLTRLKPDYLKLDGSLLARADNDTREMLRAVQALASALGAPMVAEHVDSEAKLELLRQLGVNYAQGWLIGRAEELPARGRALQAHA